MEVKRMRKKVAKLISKTTLLMSTIFVKASSPGLNAPKIPESLKKIK
ncbi:AgrD family cyclic lactone autoinducer peptide [Caldalkalibacillus mannanilyticus]